MKAISSLKNLAKGFLDLLKVFIGLLEASVYVLANRRETFIRALETLTHQLALVFQLLFDPHQAPIRQLLP